MAVADAEEAAFPWQRAGPSDSHSSLILGA